jgi:serine/threonine-protein kinase/endoribonuclease IRE1
VTVVSSASNVRAEPPASWIPSKPLNKRHNQSSHLPDSIKKFKFNAPAPITRHSNTHTGAKPDPTVQDLNLSPLVLAVTVDGHIHALDRESGQWKWTLHDDGGAALGGLHSHDKAKRQKAGEGLWGNLVKAQGRRRPPSRTNSTGSPSNETSLTVPVDRNLDDEIYVIEPFAGGDLYVYVRDGPDQGDLQKLPLSMQELVGQSPFIISSRLYVGKKDTKFVSVDIRTGRLVGVFGADAMWCEWDEQREGRLDIEADLEDDISRRPEDLLYMTRTGELCFLNATQ